MNVKVFVTQSCLILSNPMDYSPPGSSVHGIIQEEYWRGLPFPSPGHLPNPGIEPESSALQVDSLPTEVSGKPSGLKILGKYSAYIQSALLYF